MLTRGGWGCAFRGFQFEPIKRLPVSSHLALLVYRLESSFIRENLLFALRLAMPIGGALRGSVVVLVYGLNVFFLSRTLNAVGMYSAASYFRLPALAIAENVEKTGFVQRFSTYCNIVS